MKPVMNDREMKLVSELLRNSRKSDRTLAKTLKVSQPTVTRMRNRLLRDGIVREFTIIPDFVKLGYEFFAISCVKSKLKANYLERARKWVSRYPNVILMAKAEGMGKNTVIVSLHESYTEYSRFATETQEYWGDDIEDYATLLVSLKAPSARSFSLKYLAEQKETPEK
jgi:DNA-binding Lrp family transcriptional regulator